MMEQFDLVRSLTSLGVDERSAEMLKAKLRGDDFMELVNALNSNEIGNGIDMAKQILGKYDVHLGGSNHVDEYRDAELDALKRGDLFAVENFINEWLEPVTGTKLGEGFDYAVELSEDSMDKVLDWLDENKIEYLAQTPRVFHIRCEDRAAAYRVSRGLSRIMGRPTVCDGQVGEEEVMAEKKGLNKRIRDAEAKLAKHHGEPNPVKAHVIGRSGSGAHDSGNPRKDDQFSRKAKHKGRYDEDFDGAELDGDLPMNEDENVERLEEGVMGMAELNPIFRLKELAGIRAGTPGPVAETDLVELDMEDEDHISDMAANAATDDIAAPDLDSSMDPVDPMTGDVPMDATSEPVMDLPADNMDMGGMGMDDMDMAAEPMPGDELGVLGDPAGTPGDLPPMPAEPALGVAMPTQSEAMAQIEDGLNAIQMKLSDIRLSEYKTLVQKLQDLAVQVQNMGRDYLGERRKK